MIIEHAMKQTEFGDCVSKERRTDACRRGDQSAEKQSFLGSRLISARVFSHCCVLAKNDAVSTSTIVPATAGQNGNCRASVSDVLRNPT
jgi:hypothetical protein